MNTKNMTTLPLRKSSRRSPLRLGFFLIPLVLGCFALSPAARAVLPPPDGGYANQNTAEGTDALFSLTTGSNNTAIGNQALHDNTGGVQNTATGSLTLQLNTTGVNNTANGINALVSNTTGASNTAIGRDALASTTGSATSVSVLALASP